MPPTLKEEYKMSNNKQAIDPSPDAKTVKAVQAKGVQVNITKIGVKTSLGIAEQVPSPQLLPKDEADRLISEGVAEKSEGVAEK